jgi:hypothetical protein
MLIPNHPHDERLSALASADDDAVADAELTSHVDSCVRCADLVAELGVLRASLSDLPDLRPQRPLRLLPDVADPSPATPADRLAGWARRFFGPALTAGAAIAMVGLVGTAAPALDGMAGGAAPFGGGDSAGREAEEPASLATDELAAETWRVTTDHEVGGNEAEGPSTYDTGEDGSEAFTTQSDPFERSPWPMVLFSGVALIIGALMLRWILVPRAG